MEIVRLEDLTKEDRTVLLSAERVMKRAYNPYSHFYVGSSLMSSSKIIVSAPNIECASYGLTICAERAAIAKANSLGIRDFDRIAIIVGKENSEIEKFFMPCGACRQLIYEFSRLNKRDIRIISSNTKKTKIALTTISELLPYAFDFFNLNNYNIDVFF